MNIFPRFLLSLVLSLPAFGELVFEHQFKDQSGEPLAGILINVTPRGENQAEAVHERTDDKGHLKLTLADGKWFVQVDERELLERGYFCEPGSFFGEGSELTIIDAVPLRPILSINHSEKGEVEVVSNFDWISGINPTIFQRYQIERSTDLVTWESVSNILLQNPPIRLKDSSAAGDEAVYYRAVWLGPLSVDLGGR